MMQTWIRDRGVPTTAGLALAWLDSMRDSTCLDCHLADSGCEFAFDDYNQNGDCLAEK